MAWYSLPCSVGGKSDEGPDPAQPSSSALFACITGRAPTPARFLSTRTRGKKKKKKIIPELERFIYIFHTHMWGPTISVTVQGCILEVPFKAHLFLLVPSWIPSFQKNQGFFCLVGFFNLLLPLRSIPQVISSPFRKAVFQKVLLVANTLLPI